MLQCICSVVDHSWRQCVVWTKKWRSAPCGLDVTRSASCDWSVAIFITSLESQESYLTLRNATLPITRDFFCQHSTFARLYNAAASPASRLRSAGSLAIIIPCFMSWITYCFNFFAGLYSRGKSHVCHNTIACDRIYEQEPGMFSIHL